MWSFSSCSSLLSLDSETIFQEWMVLALVGTTHTLFVYRSHYVVLLCDIMLNPLLFQSDFLTVWLIVPRFLPTCLIRRHHRGVSLGSLQPSGAARACPVWYYLRKKTSFLLKMYLFSGSDWLCLWIPSEGCCISGHHCLYALLQAV